MEIEQLKNKAIENHVPIFKEDGIETIQTLIKNNQLIHILEFGTAVGYSSIAMASLSSSIKIDTYEINEESYHQALKNIEQFGLSKQIQVHLQDGIEAKLNENQYDLIFVDAAKSKYKKYMEISLHALKDNGYYVFDNLMFHHMVDDPSLTHNRNTKALVRKIKIFRDWLLSNPYLSVDYQPDTADGIAIVQIIDKHKVMSWEVQ